MSFDRAKWLTGWFSADGPWWECVGCGADVKVKPNSVHYGKHVPIDVPDVFETEFSCILECSRCGGSTAVCGNGEIGDWDDPVLDADGEVVIVNVKHYTVTRLFPRFATLAPHLFDIPKKCPQPVREELLRAFSHFWADPDAAGNATRRGLECLLDALRVPRFNRGRTGQLSTHQRVERFAKKERDLGNAMLAVKWLGNPASHGGGHITREDVADGMQLFAHVLEELYVNREERRERERMTKEILRRKGPRRKGFGSRREKGEDK